MVEVGAEEPDKIREPASPLSVVPAVGQDPLALGPINNFDVVLK